MKRARLIDHFGRMRVCGPARQWLMIVLCALVGAQPLAAQTQPDKPDAAATADTDTQPKPAAENEEEQPKLSKIGDMKTPSTAELLQQPPVDWIVLTNDDVLVVKPVQPRPNTLKTIQSKRQEILSKPQPRVVKEAGETKADFDKRRNEALEKYKDERLHLQYLDVSLPDNVVLSEEQDAAAFRLDIEKIQNIIHHEDLMLRRIDRLLDQGELQTAFELVLLLKRINPKWPGLNKRSERLVFEEAKKQAKKDPEMALASLEQLHADDATFQGLSEEMGAIVDQLIAEAVKAEDYRRARYFLTRLKRNEPEHAVARRWQTQLQKKAIALADQSKTATKNGRHGQAAHLIDEATRIWPQTPNLRTIHRLALNRFPILRVGVVTLPTAKPSSVLLTLADRRQRRLTQLTLFEPDQFERDEAAHYRTRCFELWEPTDLGRQINFDLRPSHSYWESQRVLTASEIVAELSERLRPDSPVYDERFANFVNSIVARSPFEFSIHFTRIPARIEALLTVPPTATLALSKATPKNDGPAKSDTFSTSGRTNLFSIYEKNDQQVVYRRAFPEPDDAAERHVAEIVEVRYDSYEKAIQGLLRGEVLMLPEVPSWYVKSLSENTRFFVKSYGVPTTHLLQFHPKSPVQKNAELRRALAFALDRESLLEDVVLHDANSVHGRIVTGPYASFSSAYNHLIEPRKHDFTLAISLSTVAHGQSKGKLPTLKMICDPDPIVRQVAAKMIEAWSRIGVDVSLLNDWPVDTEPQDTDESKPPWDIAYRRMCMIEPLTELWPFLTLEPTANVRSLMYLPVWLRQKLIALDTATDWSTAVDLLRDLQNDLHSTVQLIPLWEVDDVLVIRRTVQNLRASPIHPYQNVERWVLQPWYEATAPK